MAKIHKDKAIKEILLQLEKGCTFSSCLEFISKKYGLSQSTFNRYWKEANSILKRQQSVIESELLEVKKKHAKKELNKAILTKEERLVLLSKIGRGDVHDVNGLKVNPAIADRIRAITEIAKIEGDYRENETNISVQAPARILTVAEARLLRMNLEQDY